MYTRSAKKIHRTYTVTNVENFRLIWFVVFFRFSYRTSTKLPVVPVVRWFCVRNLSLNLLLNLIPLLEMENFTPFGKRVRKRKVIIVYAAI